MDFSTIISEEKIKKAYQTGEFANLPGFGKPLPKDSLVAVPKELRMAYRVLKNGGYSLEENQVKQELLTIADLLVTCTDDEEHKSLQNKYNEKLVKFNKMMAERTGKSHSGMFKNYREKVEQKITGR